MKSVVEMCLEEMVALREEIANLRREIAQFRTIPPNPWPAQPPEVTCQEDPQ